MNSISNFEKVVESRNNPHVKEHPYRQSTKLPSDVQADFNQTVSLL